MLEELKGKGLLIHHWDTDGISAACLILKKLKDKDIVNKTPVLGNYYLTDEEIKRYKKYDFIIIVDMSLPEDNVLKLAEKSKVFIFDHHLGKEIKLVYHNNPIIKGENPDDYPSASWIVNDFLGNNVNLYSILGIVGDHEQKIKKNKKFYDLINKFCVKEKIGFDDLLQMCYLIDSNYKLGDKKSVEEAPYILLEYDSSNQILENNIWNENYGRLNNEISKQLEDYGDESDGIIFKKINTSYNIISTITRKIAWDSGKNTMVLNTGFFKDKDQLYVRSIKNIESMIQRGKSLGYKCGGKKEVLGVILPKEKTDSFVNEIMDFLKNN